MRGLKIIGIRCYSESSNEMEAIMSSTPQSKSSFKTCPLCKTEWTTRDEFLSDPEVQLIGYQANLDELELGLLYFNHDREGCRTTMAVEARYFTDLYDGPVFRERMHGSSHCPGHCLYMSDLESCPVKCECSYVREVLQVVGDWPKRDP